ncbi:MAG TPA: TIGR04282 family arsenosugar biosynthesis glycosyltransferase [Ktedonobacteraceae bacterium]|jgi:hypothetical protein
MHETALVVMARYPQAGTTKTRLARILGDETTLALYRAFLIDLAGHFAGAACDLYWAYTPAEVDYDAFIRTLIPHQAQQTHSFPQQGGDLGERLLQAFRWTYRQGYRTTIVISSDSPHITNALIVQAEQALQDADVVLGPADDGGYYLIAMREPHDVFQMIPMSTSRVAAQTVARAGELGLRVRLLQSLFDVDEYPDLLRLADLLHTRTTRAPATAAVIASLRSIYDHDSRHTCDPVRRPFAALDLS